MGIDRSILSQRLAVAALSHLAVPDELADRLAVRTDGEGWAEVPAFAAEEVAAIRVEAPGAAQPTDPQPATAKIVSV